VQVKTRDGGSMDAMLIKPPDFNPARRYPVYQFTYAGPGASQVLNSWDGQSYMFYQLFAQSGVVVWVLDNRSASGRGVEAQWPVYGRLGEYELQDLEDGITWLKQQPYIDASRIVLSGWSYGGFMTAYALTHSTSWSAGVVGAPVTDWRDYDSVYTERLMKLPKNNPDGYRRTAPRFAAGKLQAKMLHPRDDGRQRALAELGAVRLRAAAAGQAVRDDGLCQAAPRLQRSAADQARPPARIRLRHARRRVARGGDAVERGG
jgi:dipeptidyl-peptidase-4